MLSRRLAPLAAACALAVALPAAAHAAVVQTIPLGSPGNGIAVAADGRVHVIEPLANRDAIFAPDGTPVGAAGIPSGAANATLGHDGAVWIGTASGLARVDVNGNVTTVPNGLVCPVVGVASDLSGGITASDAVIYSAPQTGNPCDHGLGAVDPSGNYTEDTIENAFDLAISDSGALFVPLFDGGFVSRFSYGFGGFSFVSTVTVPAGSGPDGVVVGSDGKVYVTLYNSGQIARFDQNAPNLSAATIVASNLQHPFGIEKGPYGDVVAASHDDGRLVEVGPPGIPHDVALPVGFKPQQIATSGDDIWVTDSDNPRVARIVDGVPTAAQTGAPSLSGGLPLSIDPHGNATHWSVFASKDGNSFGVANGDVPAGIGPTALTADLSGLTSGAEHTLGSGHVAGDYQLSVSISNSRGAKNLPIPQTVTVPGPSSSPPAATPVTAPRKRPKLADLVALASTKRCLATRTLSLKLRGRKAGQATVKSLRVTVGKAKAKSYTAKQLKKALTLKGLPARGTVKVKVVATLSDGSKVARTLTYKRCAAKKHH